MLCFSTWEELFRITRNCFVEQWTAKVKLSTIFLKVTPSQTESEQKRWPRWLLPWRPGLCASPQTSSLPAWRPRARPWGHSGWSMGQLWASLSWLWLLLLWLWLWWSLTRLLWRRWKSRLEGSELRPGYLPENPRQINRLKILPHDLYWRAKTFRKNNWLIDQACEMGKSDSNWVCGRNQRSFWSLTQRWM